MLGVVADYTVDWRRRNFRSWVANASADTILVNLRAYLSKYRFADHVDELLAPLAAATPDAVVSRAVGILVDFVYDEVVAKRKQAIRTMAELCRDFQDSASFRSNVLAYLQDSEFTQELNGWRNRSLEQVGLETVHSVLEQVDAPDQLRRLVGTARRMLDADPGNIALRYLSVGARAMSPWEPDRSVLDEAHTLLGSAQISVPDPDAMRLGLLQSMGRWRPSLARELANEMLEGDAGLRFARRLLSAGGAAGEVRLAAVRRWQTTFGIWLRRQRVSITQYSPEMMMTQQTSEDANAAILAAEETVSAHRPGTAAYEDRSGPPGECRRAITSVARVSGNPGLGDRRPGRTESPHHGRPEPALT